MADVKSREVYQPSDGAWYVRNKISSENLRHCRLLTAEQVDTVIKYYEEYRRSKSEKNFVEKESITKPLNQNSKVKKKNVSDIKVNIGLANVDEFIKGLKAVQREARNATAALKEVEAQQKKNLQLAGLEEPTF